MSAANYEKLFQDVPSKYALLRLLKPPAYEIELSNNKLSATCYYKDGSNKHHSLIADFSNRRMLVIDFDTAMQAVVALLCKFPKHFWVRSIAIINVSEELLDGLTPIETRMIIELIHVASSKARRHIICTEIRYHGEIITTISS